MSLCATPRAAIALGCCQRHAAPQTSGGVTRFPVPVWRCSSSERPCAAEVRENPRGACVARWYDPGTGEFMSVDPDVAETGQPYAYAGDNPVNASDPSGLHKCNAADPLTWGGCALNAVDGTIPSLIESVSWGWGPKVKSDPCDEAWTLTVNPTNFSRALWFSGVGPAGLLEQAWSQTLNLANAAANSATPSSAPRPVADTPSNYHQFACHWLVVREIPGRAFHLQTWFPDRSVVGEIGSDCNPPSAFHNPIPGT